MKVNRKRRASKVGSPEWRAKDVMTTSQPGNKVRVTDKPTGIYIESAFIREADMVNTLAHRVEQLS